MKRKLLKVIFIAAVSMLFIFSVAQVYAQTTGIDVVSLAKNKVLALISVNSTQAAAEIENEKQQVKTDTINYVDNYIKGLDDELKAYTDQQKSDAKGKLRATFNNVKSQLDSSRQGIIDDAKAQVKAAVDASYQQNQNDLNNELSTELDKKFK